MTGVVEQARAFFGVWTLNREQSQYQLGQPPLHGLYTIEPDGDALKVTMAWTAADGQSHEQVYYGVPDGKNYPYTDNPAVDTIVMTLVDAHTLDTAALKDGKAISYARRLLSEDGQTMTVTMSGVLPQGGEYTNIAIYEK